MGQDESARPFWIWGAFGLFIAWIFFSLGAYYVAQKPLAGCRKSIF